MRRRYGVKAACLVLCLSLLSGAGAVHAASIADRIDAAKEDLYDGLVKACQQYRGDAAGADRCTRAVLLTAFDDIGAARDGCHDLSELTEFMNCVIGTTSLLDRTRRLGDQTQYTAEDWSPLVKFRAKLYDAERNLLDATTGPCRQAGADRNCVVLVPAKRMAIPDSLTQLCVGSEIADCLATIQVIDFMETRTARLRPPSE